MISGANFGHAGAGSLDHTGGLVTRNDRRPHERRTRQEICMTDTDTNDADHDVSRPGCVERDILDREREIGAPKDCCHDSDPVVLE